MDQAESQMHTLSAPHAPWPLHMLGQTACVRIITVAAMRNDNACFIVAILHHTAVQVFAEILLL